MKSSDGIAVMDYRTVAEGANGIARHARDEIAMARRLGRKVLIGLETVPLTAEDQWHVTLVDSPVPVEAGAPVALLLRSRK